MRCHKFLDTLRYEGHVKVLIFPRHHRVSRTGDVSPVRGIFNLLRHLTRVRSGPHKLETQCEIKLIVKVNNYQN